MDTQAIFVGIDVSKASLELAVRPSGERLSLTFHTLPLDRMGFRLNHFRFLIEEAAARPSRKNR